MDSAIRFNSELLKLAGHYRFSPQPVPVARPTSKGKVERAIRYVRSSFFAAREFAGLDDLNDQARAWCNNEADERKWPKDKNASVRQAFQHELPAMLALPDDAYAAYDRKLVRAGKTPYVRFDGNDYSIPHQAVRQNLLVEATLTQVRVLDGINVVAEHARSFDKGAVIEKAEHIDALVKEKRNPESSRNRGMNRIQNVAPSARKFFEHAARRGHNMGRLTQLLIDYLELYGSAELEAALAACLANGRIHSDAVRTVLEQRREAQGLAPPVRMRFLKDRRIQDINIRPKSLDAYDRLLYSQENEE